MQHPRHQGITRTGAVDHLDRKGALAAGDGTPTPAQGLGSIAHQHHRPLRQGRRNPLRIGAAKQPLGFFGGTFEQGCLLQQRPHAGDGGSGGARCRGRSRIPEGGPPVHIHRQGHPTGGGLLHQQGQGLGRSRAGQGDGAHQQPLGLGEERIDHPCQGLAIHRLIGKTLTPIAGKPTKLAFTLAVALHQHNPAGAQRIPLQTRGVHPAGG